MTSKTAAAKPTRGKRKKRPTRAGGKREKAGANFRFYDNRQKYLLFVMTCGEKWAIAERVGLELEHLRPRPPALRMFDAGMGDGTVLAQVLRDLHHRFPNVPFLVVGKEISLEDVRLSLEKLPDRFHEHPQMVVVMTNLYYSEAPWLRPAKKEAQAALDWREVALSGNSAHEFHEQIKQLQPYLADRWQVRSSPKTGNPLYVKPTVLVLHRADHRFVLDDVIPKPREDPGGYDLVVASQPYRARMSPQFKVEKVLAPLARSLAPGGRMLTIHSYGADPGLELIQRIWPGEEPFRSGRRELLRVLKAAIGEDEPDLVFNSYSDKRSLFDYHMHTLPSEVGESIGTSTLMAAWNAATYVAQIEDQRFAEAVSQGKYLEATAEVLRKHDGLWFTNESFLVRRKVGR
ncbi:MAG: hypothetical protein ACTSUD_06690 [Alphaproteobacteria bacterium]